MASEPTAIPQQVWEELNTETMADHLTNRVEINALIWNAISESVYRLVRAGLIVDPVDADHAVALEREAIAAWIEAIAETIQPGRARELVPPVGGRLANAIREGRHNQNMPKTGQERGASGLDSQETRVSEGPMVSGRETGDLL